MRIWVTRAQPGADRTAQRLRALGHDPLVEPLLETRDLPAAIDMKGVGALAFTSAKGVAAFAALEPARALPVFTVGEATAAAAREAGFARAQSADGDVDALAHLIIARRSGFMGAVLHPGARELAGDLKAALNAAGVSARALALYESLPLPVTPATRAALAGLDAVLVHSPRAARLLSEVAAAHPLRVLCLSAACAAPLKARNFAGLAVAPQPNEAALLALINS